MFYPLSGSVDPSVRPAAKEAEIRDREGGERGGIYKSRIKVPFPGTSAKRQNTLKQRTSDGGVREEEEEATMAETGSKILEFCAHPETPMPADK